MKTYDELLAENKALAAKLSNVIAAWNGHDYDAINAEINKTPQQCLAEIEAEAGRAGFIAGYHKMHIEFVGSLASGEGAEFAADQYAAKTRQGVDL